MEKLVNEILKNAEQLHGFDESQKEIVQYGIQGLLEIGSNILLSVLILYQMHMIPEGMVFFLVFIPVRMFSGGYHMDTYIGCLLFSVITLVGILKSAEFFSFNRVVLFVGVVLMAVILWKIAPVIHPNRPVSQRECQKISKKLKISLIIILLFYSILWVLEKKHLCHIIFFDFLLILIMLIIGKIKYKGD
ncbi:hypothetical protein C817_02129 [Dorea sp. 5-2]|nr:hypothetical protein C817_02129 [Dorea sp. 5-2]